MSISVTTSTPVVEVREERGAYNIWCKSAVIEHPEHGRVYLTEGFGGLDAPEGATYRWRHGTACKLQPGDTMDSLETDRWNEHASILDVMLFDHDPSRPVVAEGAEVARIAEAAGL